MIYTDSIVSAYDKYLFHGDFLKAIEKVEGWSPDGITALSRTSLPPTEWYETPFSNNWHSDPLAVDAAFQLMILWTNQQFGLPSLPNTVKKYRQYSKFPSDGVRIAAKITKKSSLSATADIDFIDKNNNVIATMQGYECTMNEALKSAFKKCVCEAN